VTCLIIFGFEVFPHQSLIIVGLSDYIRSFLLHLSCASPPET
jgi:hypothetical protein